MTVSKSYRNADVDCVMLLLLLCVYFVHLWTAWNCVDILCPHGINFGVSGFTKLFSSIITSSIWCEDDKTRIVWITLLALADKDGVVEAALPGLANAAQVPIEDCRRAIEKFQAPDSESRSPANEGRRLEKIDGGFKLLNYEFYRRKLSAEERREYKTQKQAEYRARAKGGLDGKPASQNYKNLERAGIKAQEIGDSKTAEKLLSAKTK